MEPTTVSAQGGTNMEQHLKAQTSLNECVRISHDAELNVLAHGVSAGGVAATKQVPDTEKPTVVQTKAQRLRARIQFATLCWTLYLAGWNDASTGPLLPRIQEVYHVNRAIVSLIFVFACAVGVVSTFDWYGTVRAKYSIRFLQGSVLQVVAYSITATAPPFPVLLLGYVINGIGMALQDAQANGFVVSLKDNAETKIGFLHAAYGAGAVSSPLVATQFAQLPWWSFHYLVSLGVAFINTVLLIAVFRLKRQDECLTQIGQPAGEQNETENSHFRQILGLKNVHLLAMFVLVYVGIEDTISGWIVTYIIDVRGGGPLSGYISTGFYGGLTTGRIVLLWANQKVGERRVVFLYALLAIGLELVVWLVPSLISSAVSVSITGILLAPIYPIAMTRAGRVLPAWLLTGSIGWIVGFGQAGSAILPFMTGVIASKSGIHILQPLLVAMMVLMTVLWALIPSKGSRRTDQ